MNARNGVSDDLMGLDNCSNNIDAELVVMMPFMCLYSNNVRSKDDEMMRERIFMEKVQQLPKRVANKGMN